VTKKELKDVVVYDIETNGLLPEMDKVHIICARVLNDSQRHQINATDCDPQYPPLYHALEVLNKAALRIGHNIYNFDEYALRKVFPDAFKPEGGYIDTLILSRLIFPDIYGQGPNPFKVPKYLRMAHTLEAWGWRLREHKGKYTGKWDEYNDEMMEYAKQDPVVTERLYRYFMHPDRKPARLASKVEHGFAHIIARQEHRGWTFDMDKAVEMQADLAQRKADIETKLIDTYGAWWSYKTHSPAAAGSSDSDDYDNRDDDYEEEVDEEEALRRLAPVLTYPASKRIVKQTEFPDVRLKRFSEKTGKRLKDYVGPPLCEYSPDAPYVKIERTTFNPGS
jgi:hypothetical protein